MIIRNIPFKNLNETEQKIVVKYMNELYNDTTMSNCPEKDGETPEYFWEKHRDTMTEGIDGELYDGWKE